MEIKNISKNSETYIKPIAFEQLMYAVFESLGYQVEYQKKVKDTIMDMVLTYGPSNETKKYMCEIKFSSKISFSPRIFVYNVNQLALRLNQGEVGMLITTALCSDKYRKEALDKNIIILDISNLLFLIKPNSDLYQQFLELLDFSVADIIPVSPTIPYSFNKDTIKDDKAQEETELSKWAEKFEQIEPGREDFHKYEKLCIKALKLLFSNFLSIWEEQQHSNDNLYRFDLICKIKNDISDDFFGTLNTYFNTRYIVFDFKNYTEQITQKEIYTTEKYLYDKALRKVAIIVSRNGIDENALKAIKGSLREQGKVILTLTDYDILSMIKMYYEGDNPTDYLSMKLDKLLIELEK